jgi:hypothetical protein
MQETMRGRGVSLNIPPYTCHEGILAYFIYNSMINIAIKM